MSRSGCEEGAGWPYSSKGNKKNSERGTEESKKGEVRDIQAGNTNIRVLKLHTENQSSEGNVCFLACIL